MTTTDSAAASVLHDRLGADLEPAGREWLAAALAQIAAEPDTLPRLFAEAGRKVGRGPLVPSSTSSPATLTLGPFVVALNAWRRADAARGLLILAEAKHRSSESALSRAADLYFENAGADERTSAVRIFALVSAADLSAGPVATAPPVSDTSADDARTRALRAVLDALRTNVLPLFDAATAHNAFFSGVVPELEFNKAVLKRVFLDLPLAEPETGAEIVVGLLARANAELSRMLLNLAEEREISYRPYPTEIWPVVAGHPTPGLAAKMLGLIEHPDDRLRRSAASALAILRDRDTVRFIADRLSREPREPVKSALRTALAPPDSPTS